MPTILSSAEIARQKGADAERERDAKRRRDFQQALETQEISGWPDREHDALSGEKSAIERRYLTAKDEELRAVLGAAQAELVRRGEA